MTEPIAEPDQAARSASSRVETTLALGLVLVAIAMTWSHVSAADFDYRVFSDRDMVRSDVALGALPTSGAELSWGAGARVPGGAMHLMWWACLRLGAGPAEVWMAQWAALVGGALVLARTVRRLFGDLAGALALATCLASPVVANTLLVLWNPGWVPALACLAGAAWLRVLADRDGIALIGWTLALTAALQAHLSAGLLLLAMLPSVVHARPSRRGWIGSAAVAGAMYAPYLWTEARTGWTNTRAMLAPDQTAELVRVDQAHGVGTELALGVANQLALLDLVQDPWRTLEAMPLRAWGAAGAMVAVVGLLAGLVQARRSGSADVRRTLPAAVSVATLTLLLCGLSPAMNVSVSLDDRYMAMAVPAWSVLVALIWAALAEGRAVAARVALAIGLAGVPVSGWALRAHEDAISTPQVTSWRALGAWIGALRDDTGWTVDELVRRTAIVALTRAGPERVAVVSIDWLRDASDRSPPGSAPPPCALVLGHDAQDGFAATVDDALLQRVLGDAVEGPTRLDARDVDPLVTLVRYALPAGRCPMSLVDRYQRSDAETQTDWGSDGPAPGTAQRLPDEAVRRRWLVALDTRDAERAGGTTRVRLLVEVADTSEGSHVTLHSNQLRGRAWNMGFYQSAALRSPRLVARGADGGVVGQIDLARGVVGWLGESTPVSASGQLPPHAVLALVAEVDDPAAATDAAGRTVTIALPPQAGPPPG